MTAAEEFVFIDFETTGLEPHDCRVIEIGAIRMNVEGQEFGRFSCLVQSGEPIPPDISALTGITNDMVACEGVSTADAFSELLKFIGDTQCVAFNARFDRGFLEAELRRLGLPAVKNSFYCALEISRRAWPVFRSHSLDALCKFVGVQRLGHRAISDAFAGAQVFLKAAGWVWADRQLADISSDKVYISRMDIENLFASIGETLKLWTKPEADAIFAYAPSSVGGSGLALVFPKHRNSWLLGLMERESVRGLRVEKTGPFAWAFDPVP